MRVTAENIIDLPGGHWFVFGSNKQGIHGAGAALYARNKFGAVLGVGEGFTGQSYALPTKKTPYEKMTIEEIKVGVDRLYEEVIKRQEEVFHVTEVGCKHAGHSPETIAPLFRKFYHTKNVYLPASFRRVIKKMILDSLEVYEATFSPFGQNLVIKWESSLIGYGQLAIHPDSIGKVVIDHEFMDIESVKAIMNDFIDKHYKEALNQGRTRYEANNS